MISHVVTEDGPGYRVWSTGVVHHYRADGSKTEREDAKRRAEKEAVALAGRAKPEQKES
jgi:hypothetical protein